MAKCFLKTSNTANMDKVRRIFKTVSYCLHIFPQGRVGAVPPFKMHSGGNAAYFRMHYMAIMSTHASYPSVPHTLVLPYALYHSKSYCTMDPLLGSSLAWTTLDYPKPICI